MPPSLRRSIWAPMIRRSHQHSGQTRICCALLRWRPLDLRNPSPQSSCSSLVVRMSNCVAEINEWMDSDRLKLNPSKTELIWLGSSRRLEHCPVGELNIAGVPIKPAMHVRDLGVVIDNDLSLQVHINHVTRTCFYHLRQLWVIRHSLRTDTAHSLVRALVHSRLNYVLKWSSRWYVSVPDRSASIRSPCRSSPCPWPTQVGQRFGRHAQQITLAPHPRKGRVQTM